MPTPVALRPDNFTPPSRTPWGGTRVLERYKPGVTSSHPIVGESWEVSVEPSFPSHTASNRRLDELIASDPVGWLGHDSVVRFGPQTPLLVKLLDAADNLSVQVHPEDGDPMLAAKESGKPEAWIVLDANPGAGLYLGFKDGVGREQVEACLADQGRVDELMNFVPVAPGEAYVIDAGTAHAIGAGVTLLEPQLVWPGRYGMTYRFWDWNRRYDSEGRLDPHGRGRPLHVERSLAVTRWDLPGGEAFVERCRALPTKVASASVVRTRVVDWRWFMVERWAGRGTTAVPSTDRLWSVTCVRGQAAIETEHGVLELRCSESGVVPARVQQLEVSLDDAEVFAVRA